MLDGIYIQYLKILVRLKHLFVNARTRPFVSFLTSTVTYIFTFFVLLFILHYLWKEATRQYSPEVKKITIIQESSCSSYKQVELTCITYSKSLEKTYGSAGYLVADFWPEVRILNNAPDSSDKYRSYSSLRMFSSSITDGPDEYRLDESWDYESSSQRTIKNRFKAFSASEFLLESYSTDYIPYIHFSMSGNNLFLPKDKNNPYVSFYLETKNISVDKESLDLSYLYLEYNNDAVQEQDYLNSFEHPLSIASVFPQPTYMTPSKIVYKGEELQKALSNGIYVLAEDITKKKRSDVVSFICSVLLGALLSLEIQLIASIIAAWRKSFIRRRK